MHCYNVMQGSSFRFPLVLDSAPKHVSLSIGVIIGDRLLHTESDSVSFNPDGNRTKCAIFRILRCAFRYDLKY